MPATSEQQRKDAATALAAKHGSMPVSQLQGPAKELYDTMTEDQLEEMAKKSETDETEKDDEES
ncbi:MAG: DUF3008 family protein [bacterium]|nr:DUF3008 family protein [bacterium]